MGVGFSMRKDCGLDLFWDFEFDDITKAKPPDTKGVYVIQVRKPGMPPDEIMKSLESHPEQLKGEKVPKDLLTRIGRIQNIGDCPILFIGSSGVRSGSRPTLKTRYRDLTQRHAARYPIWALLHFGWELDFGWKATDRPKELEAELKEKYLNRGRRALPALVVR
jgi:hypothetical protein